MWRKGEKRIFAHSFQPAASPKALKRIGRTVRNCSRSKSTCRSSRASVIWPCGQRADSLAASPRLQRGIK
jgi:hypothetical protein